MSDDWQRFFHEGTARMGRNDLEGAKQAYRQATEAAPNEPYPHYELGFVSFLTGHIETALEEFRKTNAISPGFFLVQTEIYTCEQVLEGNLDAEGLALVRRLQELMDSGAWDNPAYRQLSAKLIGIAPSFALGPYHLGKAVLDEQPAIAERHLRRCLSMVPDDTTAIDAKVHLAVICANSGRKDEARELLQQLPAEYPGNPHVQKAAMLLDPPPLPDGTYTYRTTDEGIDVAGQPNRKGFWRRLFG